MARASAETQDPRRASRSRGRMPERSSIVGPCPPAISPSAPAAHANGSPPRAPALRAACSAAARTRMLRGENDRAVESIGSARNHDDFVVRSGASVSGAPCGRVPPMSPIARPSTAGPSPPRARPASRDARSSRRRSASVLSLGVALDGAMLVTTNNEATANDAPVSFDGRTWADDSYWHPRREQRTAVRPPATASPGAFGCKVRA